MSAANAQERELYEKCICQQLWEVDMLTSIFGTPGAMHIFDPGVISDFNEFLSDAFANPGGSLNAHLDYTITVTVATMNGDESKLDIRVELPHLYPLIESARIFIHSPLLTREKELDFRKEMENYIATFVGSKEGYVFQVVSWIQEHIQTILDQENEAAIALASADKKDLIDFERLWIYSHHIKSKTKRQEIIQNARSLGLTGFSRPGKPGIICVEGRHKDTQEFWRLLKPMHWQKITICKTEQAYQKTLEKVDKMRRFEGFHEQLFCSTNTTTTTTTMEENDDGGIMDMAMFIKYLESHKSGYMKKELFGFD